MRGKSKIQFQFYDYFSSSCRSPAYYYSNNMVCVCVCVCVARTKEKHQTIAQFLWRHKISIFWQASQSIIIILKTEELEHKWVEILLSFFFYIMHLLRHNIKVIICIWCMYRKLLLKMCKVKKGKGEYIYRYSSDVFCRYGWYY